MSRSLVLWYYCYRATTTPGFMWPVYILFMRLRGLSFTAIGTAAAATAVVSVLGELPAGYLGDRIGRRNSLLLAAVLFAAFNLGFLLAETPLAFVVVWAVLGLAEVFQSGSGDAWLFDALENVDAADRFTHVRGRGSAVAQWVGAATMIAGGLLYIADPVYPFLAGGAMSAVGIPILLTFPTTETRDEAGDHLGLRQAAVLVREQLTAPPLRSFVLFAALLFATFRAADAFIQPPVVDVLGPRLVGVTLLGYPIPEEAALGVLYASFTIAAALASDRASDLEAWLGVRTAVLVASVLAAATLLLPVVVPLALVPALFVMKSTTPLVGPIVSGYLNDHVESFGRATVLSAAALLYAVGRIPLLLLGGVVSDTVSTFAAFAALGGVFLIGAALSVGGGLLAEPDAAASGAD